MYRCYRDGYGQGLNRTLNSIRYVYKRCGFLKSTRPMSNSGKNSNGSREKREEVTQDLRDDLVTALNYSSEVLEKAVHRGKSSGHYREEFQERESAKLRLRIPPAIHNISAKKSKVNRVSKDVAFTLSSKRTKHVTLDSDGGLVDDDQAKLRPKIKPPELVAGLNRVLYQPVTLHPLRDSRTGVYNFNPDLERITPDYLESKDGGNQFVTPYKDQKLLELAQKYERRFVSSTSSMTAILSHIHYLLSNFRPLNIIDSPISKHFPQTRCSFTQGAQFPATIILRKLNNQVRSIDSDRSLDREIILSILGHSLEEFLTGKSPEQEESYHYSKIDDFILRSQLDAYDGNLPGTGVFDLKTRAVAAVRHDLSYVEKNNNHTGYEIDRIYGEFESLEREFFELIRSTLLKYSLQARIGKMDGIFVAYHNISRMFGFQYLPLDEIDYIIHSSYGLPFKRAIDNRDNTLKQIYGEEEFIMKYQRDDRKIAATIADAEFKMSIILLKNILTYIEDKMKIYGIDKWKMCKIMIKTEQVTKVRPNSDKSVTYPVLRVVVLPLPPNYADKPLVTKGKKREEILDQIQSIREYNERLLETQMQSMIGFKVNVNHFYMSNPESVSLPHFARVKNKVLNEEECHLVSKKLYQDYYHDLKKYRNPSFFHSKDVETWRSMCTFKEIEDKGTIKQIYYELLDEKLQSLQDQSIIKETLMSSNKREAIVERIKGFLQPNNGKGQERKNSSESHGPSNFQSKLRAYAKKGTLRRRTLDNLNKREASRVGGQQ